MSIFKIGQKVRKVVGYPFTGVIAAPYPDEPKCSVRHADGWDHIFHDKQLVLDNPEFQYLDLLRDVAENGTYREGRNGGTYGVFGRQIRFDLNEGFPLLTTKKMFTKGIVAELLWFIAGDTNAKTLQDQGVTIWDEWADEDGNLGPIYGKQWRRWEGHEGHIDQLSLVIEGLKKDPYSRRHVITAWNPADLDDMALPPCHCLFQFFVADGKLSCQLYQRSADLFLGVPFNIASYALLTHLVAREVGLGVGEFVHTFGDLHLYANHIAQVQEQITRLPLPLPRLVINGNASIFDMKAEDIVFEHYNSHPAIRGEVSK